ncbi:hexitol phosphatase HxpB [Sodalis endosymbiont of Henestaris halophilus]|uniref:hexitol phosphatase HxpB n=1 Tax=Sodalis endosymbiont of Henestaris halophilus TaxID=1929246 RepID=UPI000BC0A8D4|nr:hexitol phosphatase HxpB [Sodalis endosymbiont of Henestaris halophilus]SNC58818.1 2-deoxyglucose-6-phosphate phosphatase [Sodalis endosymbiont of Henestaris halophilus]
MAILLKQQAIIFDMDGLIIDSEPLWHQAKLEVFAELGKIDVLAATPQDTLGLRINEVVDLWYQESPWQGPSRLEISNRIIERALEIIEQKKPLLPGVMQALILASECRLKIGLASASPLFILERVLEMFSLRRYFHVIASAEQLTYSKPHPEVYLRAADDLDVKPMRCSALEDSINGMIATRAARMRSIVVPDAGMRDDPCWCLAQVQLPTLLALEATHIL